MTQPTQPLNLDAIHAKAAELRERLNRKNPWPHDNESHWMTEGWKNGTRNALDKLHVDAMAEEIRRLRAENDRLTTKLAAEERLHGDTIDDRDRFHDMADKLAYAIAPEEVIGEHSSMNCPWDNALDLITPKAEVDKLRARVAELEQTATEVLATFAPMHEVYGGPVAYYDGSADITPKTFERWTAVVSGPPAAEESHVVADDSSDPEHIDDCPGCEPASA